MGFLAKFWNGLKTVLGDFQKVEPEVSQVVSVFNPTAAAAIDDFSHLVSFTATGASTLAAATNGDPTKVNLTALQPQASAILLQTEALAGKTVVDPTKFADDTNAILTALQGILANVK